MILRNFRERLIDIGEKRQIQAKDERKPIHKLKNNVILPIYKETQHSLIFCFVEDERMLCYGKRLTVCRRNWCRTFSMSVVSYMKRRVKGMNWVK